MKRVEVEMLSDLVNCPVLRIPQRRFPGIMLQGDSLAVLASLAEEVRELVENGDKENLTAAADMLANKLAGYLIAYEDTMRANKLELPYPHRECACRETRCDQ